MDVAPVSPAADMGADSESKSEKVKELKKINYSFLDGLRGLGAFAVYLGHSYDLFPGGNLNDQE
jgi:hypothetical protein